MAIIDNAYISALRIPAARVLLCFVKKLTVIGIIGKTHGVSSASHPPRNPAINNPQLVLVTTGFASSKRGSVLRGSFSCSGLSVAPSTTLALESITAEATLVSMLPVLVV